MHIARLWYPIEIRPTGLWVLRSNGSIINDHKISKYFRHPNYCHITYKKSDGLNLWVIKEAFKSRCSENIKNVFYLLIIQKIFDDYSISYLSSIKIFLKKTSNFNRNGKSRLYLTNLLGFNLEKILSLFACWCCD